MALFSRVPRTNPNDSYERLKKAAADARLPYERDWWLNVAFYLGEQYVEWADDVRSIRQIARPANNPNGPRPVVNKIMHFVGQEHAMALQDKPTPDVLPATDDPIDISESQVALAYLRYLCEPQVGNFDRELSLTDMWALTAGEGYIKWHFNAAEKRPDFTAVSPFDLFVDPYVTDFYKARYCIHSQFMDVEQINDVYGVEIPAESHQRVDPVKVKVLQQMGQAPVLTGATVNELWMKPCKRYPEGLFVVWTDRHQLIAPKPFPYEHKQLPFTQLGSVPIPGSLHHHSAVKFLRPAQMELNKYHAQRIAIREKFAAPKWWVPLELELEQPIDDSPFQVLRGNSQNGTLKPEILQPSSFPGNDDGEWIAGEMMHIVGLHEISQGQVPGRVEAAKAIEMLKESDASRQRSLRDSTSTAISRGFWQILMLAKQYVSEEQIVQTYSREGVPEVHRFKTERWKPGLRVQVPMGTGLARSRAARQDQLLTYWREGIMRDPETMANLLEIPLPTLVSHKAFDIRLARNENLTLADEKAVTANSWDDHEIHIREHNNYRKTLEYQMLEDDAKQKFEHHVEQHETLQMDALTKLAQKQQLLMMTQQPPSQAQTTPGEPPAQESQPPV